MFDNHAVFRCHLKVIRAWHFDLFDTLLLRDYSLVSILRRCHCTKSDNISKVVIWSILHSSGFDYIDNHIIVLIKFTFYLLFRTIYSKRFLIFYISAKFFKLRQQKANNLSWYIINYQHSYSLQNNGFMCKYIPKLNLPDINIIRQMISRNLKSLNFIISTKNY